MSGNQGYLTIKEASHLLRVSQSALRLWISQRRLRCVRAGGRVLLDRAYLETRAASGQLLEPVCQGERSVCQTDAQ
jgi:excisionase family DNA binding protein